jgi:hypothetical protein
MTTFHIADESHHVLAECMKLMWTRREASYRTGTWHYALSYSDVARNMVLTGEADEKTAWLAQIMLQAGYCDFHDWADFALGQGPIKPGTVFTETEAA